MMKKSAQELEAEMLEAMELRESKKFENELADFVAAHKDLAVKPKNPRGLLEATMRDANTKADALKLLKSTKVHFMSYDKHGSKGEGVYCSCGMFKLHKRGKVLAAWADKHYEKYGHFWKRS